MIRYGARIAQLAVGCLLTATSATAFEVSPLIQMLRPASGQVDATITVRNTTDRWLPIEVLTFELALDGGGPSRGAAADERLFALPPAALVEPGRSQTVRVRWLDDRPLLHDRSFIVAIEQPAMTGPVARPDAGVQLLLTFNTIVHVEASGTAPALRIEDIVTDDGAVRFVLVNAGHGNAYGERIRFTLISADGVVQVVPGEAVSGEGRELFLPPGARQRVRATVPALRASTPIRIDVDHEPR